MEEEWAEDERRIHGEFEGLVTSLEDYLSPLSEHLFMQLRWVFYCVFAVTLYYYLPFISRNAVVLFLVLRGNENKPNII